MRIEDVDLYTGPGMGIVGIGSRDIALHRVRIIPKPGTRRIVSTTADATHFINCSGTIELKDCEFAGMGDDHLNVHGQYHFVHEVIDARTIEARIGTLSGFGQWSDSWVWGWASPPAVGDSLEFARHDDLNVFGKAKIESIDYNQETGRSRIVFTEPHAAKLSEGHILQCTRQVPKMRISGCKFGPNRARGTLITTRDVVIENNTFDRLGGTAVFVCCEVDWLETPAPAHVTIRNNTFADCGYAVANEGGGAVTVLLKQHRNIAGWVKNVVIEGNTVCGTHGAGLQIEQADGLVIRNNTFEKYNPAVVVRRSQNVQIDGNQLTHGSRRVVVEPSCDMKTVRMQQLPFRPTLARVQLDRDKVRQGESLQMTLEFRGNVATERDFHLIVELFPLGRPPDFAATLSPKQPTSAWPPGEIVSEGPFEITIPGNIGPGWRRVLLGLAEPAAGGARLQLDNDDRHERHFRYYFGEIEILPADSTTRGKPVVWLPVSDPARPQGGTEEWRMRHGEDVAEVRSKAGQVELLFIGDSITGGWMDTGKSVWDKEYASPNVANIGIAGSQTQHVLWQFDNGAIDGISPRVAVVMIGVNNILGSPSHSAQDITRGIQAIVRRLREKLPSTKILLLGTFPADRDPTRVNRQKIRRINAMIAKLGDGRTVRFLDISDALLNADGTFSPEVSPDAVHLTPKGYQIWADAMRPLLGAMLKDTAGDETPKPLETFELSNDTLKVRMITDRPGVAGYEHLATGEKLAAATVQGLLLINGRPVPWNAKTEQVRYWQDRQFADRAMTDGVLSWTGVLPSGNSTPGPAAW